MSYIVAEDSILSISLNVTQTVNFASATNNITEVSYPMIGQKCNKLTNPNKTVFNSTTVNAKQTKTNTENQVNIDKLKN